MSKRRRARRWMWVWAAMSLLLGAVWLGSSRGILTWWVTVSSPAVNIDVGLGTLQFAWIDFDDGFGPFHEGSARLSWRRIPAGEGRWHWLPYRSWPGDRRRMGAIASVAFTGIPIWILLALALALTLWMYRRSRIPGVGRCSTCRYDLTDNTTGVCPECGLLASGERPVP